jgi:hypothetical protein
MNFGYWCSLDIIVIHNHAVIILLHKGHAAMTARSILQSTMV